MYDARLVNYVGAIQMRSTTVVIAVIVAIALLAFILTDRPRQKNKRAALVSSAVVFRDEADNEWFRQDLFRKGHRCVRILETNPTQTLWCRQATCTGFA